MSAPLVRRVSLTAVGSLLRTAGGRKLVGKTADDGWQLCLKSVEAWEPDSRAARRGVASTRPPGADRSSGVSPDSASVDRTDCCLPCNSTLRRPLPRATHALLLSR